MSEHETLPASSPDIELVHAAEHDLSVLRLYHQARLEEHLADVRGVITDYARSKEREP